MRQIGPTHFAVGVVDRENAAGFDADDREPALAARRFQRHILRGNVLRHVERRARNVVVRRQETVSKTRFVHVSDLRRRLQFIQELQRIVHRVALQFADHQPTLVGRPNHTVDFVRLRSQNRRGRRDAQRRALMRTRFVERREQILLRTVRGVIRFELRLHFVGHLNVFGRFQHRLQRFLRFEPRRFATFDGISVKALRVSRNVNFALGRDRSRRRLPENFRFVEELAAKTIVNNQARSAQDGDDLAVDRRRGQVLATDVDGPKSRSVLRVDRLQDAAGRRNKDDAVLKRRARNFLAFPIERRLREPSASQPGRLSVPLRDKAGFSDPRRRRVRGDANAHKTKNQANREMSFHSKSFYSIRSTFFDNENARRRFERARRRRRPTAPKARRFRRRFFSRRRRGGSSIL